MGAVFLAEDLTLERPVAIKVLPPEVSHDQSLIGRFEREARTAAKLDHPNIVPIFSVEAVDDLHFFVMKYVDGDALDALLRQGGLPVDVASNYLWEAARALGHAHKRGVVHRDIKPANIMLDHDGRVMLADFGISKAMQSTTHHTGTGQVIGTPHYMSPEQAKGDTVDGRSDQYSLGIVGYQMLTGRLPFADDSVHTVIYKHIFENPEPIRNHNPDVPPFLASAVHRALAKDPADRFPSMEDFAAAVQPDRPLTRTSAPSAGHAVASAEFTSAPTEITAAPLEVASVANGHGRTRRGIMFAIAVLVAGAAAGGYLAWDAGLLRAAGLPLRPSGRETLGPGPADSTPEERQLVVRMDSAGQDSSGVGADSSPADTPVRPRVVPPPAQPPETPTTGRITIDAEPWGRVYIDGVHIDDTPVGNHELAAGLHVIRIERDGCQSIVDTVTVSPGNTPVRVKKFFVC
jgi:serine/threonine-protein kinase